MARGASTETAPLPIVSKPSFMAPAFVTVGATAFAPQHPTRLSPRRPARRPTYRSTRAQAPSDPSVSPGSAPPTASSAPSAHSNPSSSEFHHRFNDIRGKDVEPVSATMARFNTAFMRPVPIVYRAVINEMLTTTHLAKVCAMWRFDAVFAYGFDCIFSVFLRYYPNDSERDLLYKCCSDAVGLEINVLKSTASSVIDWVEGKTQDDVFSALKAASPGASADTVGPVIEALAYIRDAGDFDWYYSRLFGIGLIQIMDAVGVELTIANAETWAEAIGVDKSKFASEMGTYLSSMERLKQAEQIFAEVTAREAKKTAERLAAKAEAAAKEAEALEKGEDLASAEGDNPVTKVEGVKDETSTSA